MSERIEQLQKLLKADPNDPFCLYGLAQEYGKQGDHEQAVAWYDRTLQADANYCYAYYHRAKSLDELDRTEEARETLERGIERAQAVGDEKALGELAGYLDALT